MLTPRMHFGPRSNVCSLGQNPSFARDLSSVEMSGVGISCHHFLKDLKTIVFCFDLYSSDFLIDGGPLKADAKHCETAFAGSREARTQKAKPNSKAGFGTCH